MYALLLLAAAWTRHDDPLVVMATYLQLNDNMLQQHKRISQYS